MERKQRLSFKLRGSSLLSCNSTTVGTTSSFSKEPSTAYPCRANESLSRRIRSASGNTDHHQVPVVRVSVECGGCHSVENRLSKYSSAEEKAEIKKKDGSSPFGQIRCITVGREATGSNSVSPSSPLRTYVYYYKKKEKNVEKVGEVVRNNKIKMKVCKTSDGRQVTSGSLFSEESFSVGYSGSELNQKKKKSSEKDGKRRTGFGFAVVKQSNDPYGDFRSSMAEMIMEKRLFGASELSGLLMSYLSLNSARHHPVIIEAFSELRRALHDA